MLYLADIELIKIYYSEEVEREILNHIVEAESEEDVKDKVRNYYDLKDSDYYVSHGVDFNYINEVIK